MSGRRLSPFVLLLLFITAVSVAFGVWGLIQVGSTEPVRFAGPVQGGLQDVLESKRDSSPTNSGDKPSSGASRPRTGPANGANRLPDAGAAARDDSPVLSDPSDKGNGKLTGTVQFADGKPVPGVKVSLTRTDLNIPQPQWDAMDPEANWHGQSDYYREITRQTRITTTGPEGRFAFSGLDEARSYQVYAGSREHGFNSASNVTPGEEVTIWLLPRVALTGTVKREDGTPVDRFTVDVRIRQDSYWNSIGQEQFSDAKGQFRTGAQKGKCRVVVRADGLSMKGQPEVEVTEAGASVDIIMGQAATLSGTITDKAGAPLKGASVQVHRVFKDDQSEGASRRGRWMGALGDAPLLGGPYWLDDEGQYWSTSDNRGRYRVQNIVPGEYNIIVNFGSINDTRKATLNPGANEQDFSLEAGCQVVVKVSDPRGNPVIAAWTNFMADSGNSLDAAQQPQQKPGEFVYAGLPVGKCRLNVTAQGYPPSNRDIELKPGENRFEVTLAEGAWVEGRVSTTAGAVIRAHYVRIGKPGKVKEAEWESGAYCETDAKGVFRLGPVEPGDYELMLTTGHQVKVTAMAVRLVGGENKQDMIVESQCSLRVTVRGPGGQPLTFSNVNVAAGDNSAHYYMSTNVEGVCEFHFLKEGEYTLTAHSHEGTETTQKVNLRRGPNEIAVDIRQPDCVRVTWIEPEGEGAKAGLQVGDLITAYNGTPTPTLDKLAALVRTTDNTVTVSLSIIREGAAMVLTAKGGLLRISGEASSR